MCKVPEPLPTLQNTTPLTTLHPPITRVSLHFCCLMWREKNTFAFNSGLGGHRSPFASVHANILLWFRATLQNSNSWLCLFTAKLIIMQPSNDPWRKIACKYLGARRADLFHPHLMVVWKTTYTLVDKGSPEVTVKGHQSLWWQEENIGVLGKASLSGSHSELVAKTFFAHAGGVS